MSRNTGTFNFAANFEGLLKAPIDGRQLVGTYADLTLSATWNASGSVWLYNGAIVVVGSDPTPSNNGVYWLCDATNYTLASSWVQVGTGSGTLTGATNGLSVSGQRVVLGGALTGDTEFSGGVLKYSTPQAFTNDSQIVDKGYVDSVALGLDPKLAVDVATTSGVTLSGLTTIDGVLLVNGDRVLVKNQGIGYTGHTDNGIYIASANTWTRATDFDASGETVQGSLIPVISGLTQGNTIWVLITANPITPGTTPMEFTLFSTVTMTAGNSIIISGSTISVDITTGTLYTALNNLQTTKLDVSAFSAYTGTTQTILDLALTGATNGLTVAPGRLVALGGALTGDTSIDTTSGKLTIGSPNNSVVVDDIGVAVIIGDETLGSNYIRTSSSVTDVIASLGNLNLCGNNVTMGTVNLNYAVHPTIWTNDTQIVDKKYVDDLVTGGTTYNCASPATVTVGGVTAGTVLTGKTTNEILKEILVPYLLPTFSAFGSTVIPSSVEVGCTLSGSKAFCWTFTNASNVAGSTMCIRDVSTGSTLATNISTTSPQSATVTTRTFVSCGQSQIWCGSAKNSCGAQFGSSTYTTTAYLPYYYGKCTCPGPSGANRPTGTSAMVVGGTYVLAAAAGDITIAYNSTANDYLWFAIPSSVLNKNCWCCNPSINGTIGGAVSPGGNLFPAPDYENISVTTACWTANYDVYISNKQSIAGTLKMGNV